MLWRLARIFTGMTGPRLFFESTRNFLRSEIPTVRRQGFHGVLDNPLRLFKYPEDYELAVGCDGLAIAEQFPELGVIAEVAISDHA